jgi:hypothetical protein
MAVRPHPDEIGPDKKLTERMNVLQARESIENSLELVAEGLLSVLDLTGVETCPKKI